MTLDNLLNTHDFSAFYENLPADEAFALAQPFEFFFTPRSARRCRCTIRLILEKYYASCVLSR